MRKEKNKTEHKQNQQQTIQLQNLSSTIKCHLRKKCTASRKSEKVRIFCFLKNSLHSKAISPFFLAVIDERWMKNYVLINPKNT